MATVLTNPVNFDVFGRPEASKPKEDDPQVLQDRFLKLLTTQLKMQDPFNPMDNFQMTSQLAQLSTVEGIGKMNQTLQSVLSASQQNYIQSQSMVAASLVGKQTLDSLYGEDSPMFDANKNNGVMNISSEGGKSSAAALLGSSGERLKVKIYAPDDKLQTKPVREISIPNPKAGLVDIAWDGLDSSGKAVAAGDYQFKIELDKPSVSNAKTLALSWKSIESVAFDDLSRPYLVVAGGHRLNMADVFQIKA